ncbi:MAG: ImmA/IrrE family metallo-endopeptidase [Lachnospiraceae bacterium]|nr:ImmA/IrrE family metallo-endopeptidase [Lachnospiraceae bacterium]
MRNVLGASLYKKQANRFERIADISREFSGAYCGSSILGTTIFGIAENYARKKERFLEVLRYPFKDTELWAFTFVKRGTIFLCVNSELAMCKQIFAVAHELYHIRCYAEDINTNTIQTGSILESKVVDETVVTQEDLEANAFAGLVLMPDALMREQVALYGITKENIKVDDILTLMELFALPYKAVVLRLYEGQIITETKAEELLKHNADYVAQRIELTGKARQWQMNSVGIEYFGSLLDNLEFNSENELLTESREAADRKFLEELKASFRRDR